MNCRHLAWPESLFMGIVTVYSVVMVALGEG